MGEPDEPSLPRSVKSRTAAVFGLGRNKDTSQPVLPTANTHTPTRSGSNSTDSNEKRAQSHNHADGQHNTQGDGASSSALEAAPKQPLFTRMKDGSLRFLRHTKNALMHSWINVLLVFVPLGIIVKCIGLRAEIVFSMNAIAIIPLAGLLAFATEVVAERVGDTL